MLRFVTRSLWTSFTHSTVAEPVRVPVRRAVLRVGPLEERSLPASISWVNPGSGNWHLASNWSTGTIPTSADDVTINTAVTVAIGVGHNESARSLTTTANAALSFTGGSLTIGADSTLSGPLTMTAGLLTATGAGTDLLVAGTTDIATASLYALNGATFALPNLTTYNTGSTFRASGVGSLLDVSALTSFTQSTGWIIQADSGGTIDLSGLTSLQNTLGGNGITLHVTGGGNLENQLTTLSKVSVTLDGSDPNVANTWTELKNGGLDVGSGTYTLPNLTNIDGSNVGVLSGGLLALPNLTTFATNSNTFQATGTGVLDLSALTTVTHTGNWTIQGSGGRVKLNSMSRTQLAVGDRLLLSSAARIDLAEEPIQLPAPDGTVFNIPELPTGIEVLLGIFADHTEPVTFNIGAGPTVSLYGSATQLSLIGGATFNVGLGAIVDLTTGFQPRYGGTLTGSGLGTVRLGSGRLYPVTNVTLNFPGSMFQWTGGAFHTSTGDITNLGTMTLAGSAAKGLYEGGTLTNFGTLVQTGTGNFSLHNVGVFPTTLRNEVGGTYLLQTDAGIDNFFGGPTSVQNKGTITKTGGTGVSHLTINGAIDNTGTIEAASGTLYLNANSITQVAGNTLTGGTWQAANGVLQFPIGTALTNNAGNVTLGDDGLILGLSGLTANSGTFTVAEGGLFNATGDFTNSGTLRLAGALNIAGNFTQTLSGVVNEQIGGTASTDLGQLGIGGTATLAGTFDLDLVNGFTPTVGDHFFVAFFADVVGNFTTYTGLEANFVTALNATNLELIYDPAAAAELTPTSITAPPTLVAGQSFNVTWDITNNGANASGPWQDSIYLSATPTLTPDSIYVGAVLRPGGLAALDTYTGTFTGKVPTVASGNYYVLVQTDSLYQIADQNRANNLRATNVASAVTVPALTLGVPTTGTFAAGNEDHYYQVTVPAGGSLSFALTSNATSGTTALYVRQNALPTLFTHEWSATITQPNQIVTVPFVTTPTTYYVLAHSVAGDAATAEYTLTATQTNDLTVHAPTPPWTGGNGGQVTLLIDGTNFTTTTTATLTLNSTTLPAVSVRFISASQMYATFDLTGVELGAYELTVQQGTQTVTAPATVEVVPPTFGKPLQIEHLPPAAVRAGRRGVIQVTVANVSNNDIPAPMLIMNSNGGAVLNLPDMPEFTPGTLTFLATSPTGNAGVLRPGETVTLAMEFRSMTVAPFIYFTLSETDEAQLIDWNDLLPNPNDFPNGVAALANLQNETGPYWDGYVRLMSRMANILPPELGSPSNLKTLFNLALEEALAAVNTSLSGRVQSTNPAVTVAGRTITATDSNAATSFATTIRNDGSFVFATLPAGSYTFQVAGLQLDMTPPINVADGQALTGITLNTDQGAILAGVVQSQATGKPLSGATLQVFDSVTGVSYQTTTDSTGAYHFTGLPTSVYELLVTASGYAEAHVTALDVTSGYAMQDVALADEAAIFGTVTLDGGPGLTDLAVVARKLDTGSLQAFSTIATTNSFAVAGLPAGTYDITVQLPGYITQTLTNVVVNAGAAVDLGNVLLAPASTIQGKITSNDPRTSASYLVVEVQHSGDVVSRVITDELGFFEVHNLEPGTYDVLVPDATITTSTTVTVALGETLADIDLTLPPGGALTGVVTDQTANPLERLPVSLAGPNGYFRNTITDATGAYEFTGLPAGTYTVYLALSGPQASQPVTITEVDGTGIPADLQLAYVATVTGTLTDGNNNPVAGVVTLYQNGAPVADASADAEGVYTFFVRQAGTFDLAAYANDGTFNTATGISVGVGASVTQDFQMGGGTLVVAVNDGGNALEGELAALEVTFGGKKTFVMHTTIAADGTATFPHLVAGMYTVAMARANGHAGQVTVNVAAHGTTNDSLNLTPRNAVTGTITDEATNPIPNPSVVFQLASDLTQTYFATPAEDGTYALFLPAGLYDVTTYAAGYMAETQLGVNVAGSMTLNYDLATSTTTITGRLVDEAGYGVANGSVTLYDSTGHIIGFVLPQADGSFSVTTAAGTNLTLASQADGYAVPPPLNFDATTGTTTPLGDIALQAIATAQTPLVPNPPAPQPKGGQAFAEVVRAEADELKAKVKKPTPLDPPPNCPQCQGIYKEYVKAHREATLDYEIFQSIYELVSESIDTLNQAVADETKAINESLPKNPAAIPTHLLPAPSMLNGFLVPIYNLAEQVRGLLGTLMAAPSAAAIEATAQQILSKLVLAFQLSNSAERLLEISKHRGLNDDILYTIITQLVIKYPNNSLDQSVGRAYELYHLLLKLRAKAEIWEDSYRSYGEKLVAYNLCRVVTFCQPQPPPNPPGSSKPTHNVTPNDPNAIVGPGGYGPEGYLQPNGVWPYTIQFENVGTAAALNVIVTQQLDADLDWSTFQLASFGFGAINVVVPHGLTQYQTVVAYENTDGSPVNVLVALDFNVATGSFMATLTSINPNTGAAPEGVFDGFLYPEEGTGEGQGYLSYTIQPRAELTTGIAINGQAAIVFDTNDAILTEPITNTIDADQPTSAVAPLPSASPETFTVSWASSDVGSGIAYYDVYVGDNGVFSLWQGQTTATSAMFTGDDGHTYTFYAVATDNVGQVQPFADQVSTRVNRLLYVVTNPTATSTRIGQQATFTATAFGTPKPKVQWQFSGDGLTWSSIPGATSSTFRLTTTQAHDGNLYRAVFSSKHGTAISLPARLSVEMTIQASTKNQSINVAVGTEITLLAVANGSPAPTVQWERSTDEGQTFSPLIGATTPTLTFAAQLAEHGFRYRAVFTNSFGSTTSAPLTLLVMAEPSGTADSTPQAVQVGQAATFTVASANSIQWQVSNDGVNFANVKGATKPTLTIPRTITTLDGNVYRALLTNAIGQIATPAAMLTVAARPIIHVQPTSTSIATGQFATFTAAAKGGPPTTVQWEVSTNKGKSYTTISGATLPILRFPTSASDQGKYYRAVFTNPNGTATTKAAILTVGERPAATTPSNISVNAGQTATLTIAPTGTPMPTIQWQVSSNGVTWTNVKGATKATLKLTRITTALDGNRYQAVLTNVIGRVTTPAAQLTVSGLPFVTLQPTAKVVASGNTVTFTVAATGQPTATVQWHVSTDKGKTYTPLAGATTTILTFAAQFADNGKVFQAVFTNANGTVKTKAVTLTVGELPSVTDPVDVTVNAGSTATLTLTLPTNQAAKIQWQVSTDGGSTWTNMKGATKATLQIKRATTTLNSNQYRAVVTNKIGSTTTAAASLTVLGLPTLTDPL